MSDHNGTKSVETNKVINGRDQSHALVSDLCTEAGRNEKKEAMDSRVQS